MKVGITGINGFIGSALARKLGEDKNIKIYPYPRKDLDKLFLFGSPSSEIIYKENIDYCFEETINGFLNAIQYCRDYGIKLIYPSSATVYNRTTLYSRCKAALEEIHLAYGGNVLGVRIFAGYGPGEAHKGEYASVVYQFCKQMKNGERPVVFGDGTQTRDFIYIDDVVDNILRLQDECVTPCIKDIGTGENPSFNEIVDSINDLLGSEIKPLYKSKPNSDIKETICSNPSPVKVSLREGIKKILDSL